MTINLILGLIQTQYRTCEEIDLQIEESDDLYVIEKTLAVVQIHIIHLRA